MSVIASSAPRVYDAAPLLAGDVAGKELLADARGAERAWASRADDPAAERAVGAGDLVADRS